MIAFGVTEEEQLLEESARRFGDDRLRGPERDHEHDRGYPSAVRAEFAEMGFGAMSLPEAMGGADLPLAVVARAWEKLAAADPSAAIAMSIPGITALARSRAGAEIAKTRKPGAVIVVDSRSEAMGGGGNAGSASGAGGNAPRGVAERRPGAFEIPWVPCANPEWIAIVYPDGVELATDLTATAIVGSPCGLRAAGASKVTVKETNREPIADASEAAKWLVELRVFAAACMMGAARDAASYARKYCMERIAFGKPIAHHQGLAFALVDAATDLDIAGLALAAATVNLDPIEVANAHALVTETALQVADRSVQALGGHGYLFDHPVEKRMRDIRALASLYGGAAASSRDAADAVLTIPNAMEVSK
ncbi:MAG: acyl-CoA dehydrogenase family protein [Kofleriaceae bacterium]